MSIKKQNVLLASISYIIFGFVILIILSYQIRTHTAIFLSDGYFHFSRFYDAAQQIKTNNFSFFQSNWGFNQSERIVNALYGPYFAYLMGAILLICGTWFKFQIVTSFLISFIAATGMYKCLKYVSSNNIANILISLIYITAIKFWSCGSNFNAISSALAPFALYCGLRMILDHKKPISWSQLALTMSIVAQIHLLSTLLFTTLLIPFFIIGLVQTKFRKQMMLNLTVAVLVTLLLTMNIWIKLYYFHKLDIVSNPGAFNMYKATLSWHHYTPISICLILVQFLYVSFYWKQASTNCIITVLALVFLILCTKLCINIKRSVSNAKTFCNTIYSPVFGRCRDKY